MNKELVALLLLYLKAQGYSKGYIISQTVFFLNSEQQYIMQSVAGMLRSNYHVAHNCRQNCAVYHPELLRGRLN